MAVRFPGSRDVRRLPESGPGHIDSINRGTWRKNLTLSVGRWKIEVGRADHPDPKTVEADAHSLDRDWSLRVSNSESPSNLPEHRPGLEKIPRKNHTVAFVQEGGRRLDRIGSESDDFWEALELSEQEALQVLDIVEGQLYNQLTRDQADYLDYRPRPPLPLRGQNCTVLLTDIVGFSSPARTDQDCRVIRNALYGMTNMMLRGIAEARSESRGDGMLTVAWPGVPTRTVINRLLTELLPALERHNSTHCGPACFQLRAAIGVGPLVSDAMGPSGEAITTIARLIEAPVFKQAMAESGAGLGLIATTFVYESVIRHDRSLTGCRQVQVKAKGFSKSAWMNLFGTSVSSHIDPYAAVA